VPKKAYGKSKKSCRVTFELPAVVEADRASVCGEFNGWSPHEHPMVKRKDGRFSITVSLDRERAYRYRFLLDGERWENDWAADRYVRNDYGTEDSLIEV
jgi:1,4-alpha-glucan branching enzyme